DLRAVDQLETLRVNDDLDAALLEHDVAVFDAVREIYDVSEAIAAGLLDAQAQPDTLAACVQVVTDPVRGRFCKRYCHDVLKFLPVSSITSRAEWFPSS